VTPPEFREMFDPDETKMIGLLYGEKNYNNTLSHFHLTPKRNGWTDRFAISISRISMLTRNKKWFLCFENIMFRRLVADE